MSLARPFKAGARQKCSRRVATPEIGALFNRRYATKPGNHLIPALKRRAKLIPTLRAEDLIRASFSLSWRIGSLNATTHAGCGVPRGWTLNFRLQTAPLNGHPFAVA